MRHLHKIKDSKKKQTGQLATITYEVNNNIQTVNFKLIKKS